MGPWGKTALLGALVTYGWAFTRVRREYKDGHLSPITSGAVYVAYGLHALAFLAAIRRPAPPALPSTIATAVGLPLALKGTALFVSGWRALPVADDSGLATGGLVTGGAYRVSRNPQNVGWALLLLGVALVRRSGAGAGLTALFWAAFRAYLPLEEAFLERTYGEAYWHSRDRAPRFLGRPARDA